MAAIAASLLFSSALMADDGLGTTLANLGQSAAQGYLGPFVTVFGSGMNSGWTNSSKAYSMFNKLPVGITVGAINLPIVMLSDKMKTFDFTGNLPMKPLLPGGMVDSLNTFVAGLNANPIATAALANAGIDPATLGIDTMLAFQALNQATIFGKSTMDSVTMDSLLSPNGVPTKTLSTLRAYNVVSKAIIAAQGGTSDGNRHL